MSIASKLQPGTLSRPVSLPVDRPRVGLGRVAVLIVTWNRKDFVANILRSVAKQTYPASLLDVIVIDNAGTDGTLDHLVTLHAPELVVSNTTLAADQPAFADAAASPSPNRSGFASLTIVRNSANLGGCGGFNTGFAYVEQRLPKRPDMLWLVDDDADVAPDTLEQLAHAMASDPSVGLVGSRTVDIRDRARTIETTIYFNDRTGAMQDHAPAHHRFASEHLRWVSAVGDTRGDFNFTGVMNVDVVSACSMLARWDAIVGPASSDPAPARTPVGFWDARYFIYCDDADWCLRFAKHGWRVVLCLDAIVYHTPWNLKLTPARIYYANRNRVWMAQKILSGHALRRVTRIALRALLKDALRAAMHRRAFHSRIILDTARDVVINRSGKTGSDGPPPMPVSDALRSVGALNPGATIAVLCSQQDSLQWFHALREHAHSALGHEVRWLPIVRNDVPGHDALPNAIVYGGHLASRLKKQLAMLARRPVACVVFEQTNDFPVLIPFGPSHNIHIDQKNPLSAQVERDTWPVRASFVLCWCVEAIRCAWYALTVKPFARRGRYG